MRVKVGIDRLIYNVGLIFAFSFSDDFKILELSRGFDIPPIAKGGTTP